MSSEVSAVSVHQPVSLLQHCTELVAGHLDLVESFCGLPSLIGEKIFSVACMMERFRNDVLYSTLSVGLFSDAYGEEFLSKLNISGHHLGLNYCLEQILLFTDLTELDVSNCGLGDNHEIISHFENLQKLEVLSLRDNVLSNSGIQKMTVPYRMFSRGPAGLKLMDLTGNSDISKDCLKYLVKFQHLRTVMFSEIVPKIKSGTHGGWILSDADCQKPVISTEGWAKLLINRWMKEAMDKSRYHPERPKSNTGLFSIKKQQDMTMIKQYSSQTCAGNDCKEMVHNFVAERIKVPVDERQKSDRTNTCSMGQTDSCDIREIQDLYKTYEKSDLQLENSDIRLDSCDKTLGKITNKKTHHLTVKSSARNKLIFQHLRDRSMTSSIKKTPASLINPFKFGIEGKKYVNELKCEQSCVVNSTFGYNHNEIAKENSVDTETLISDVNNSAKQNTRKRKKIVLIKKTTPLIGYSNVEVETSPEGGKTEILYKDTENHLAPAAKKMKKSLKPSIFDSLGDYY